MKRQVTKEVVKQADGFIQLESLSGFIIYLGVMISLLSFLIFSFNSYAIFCCLLFGVRIVFTRQRLLITSCLFLCIPFSLYFLQVKTNTDKGLQLKSETVSNCPLNVLVDTVEVDGQSLKFTGVITTTGEKVKVHKWLKTKAEHDWFSSVDERAVMKVSGELSSIPSKRNLGAFDYKKYASQHGIYRQLKVNKIQSLTKDKTFNFVSTLRSWRAKVNHYITDSFPPTTASYLKSLFIGIKDQEFKLNQNQLSRLGILHFFSISGLHTYFFLGIVGYVLRRIGLFPETVYWAEIIFLLLFLGLTGFSTSVGRSVFYLIIFKTVRQFRLTLSVLDVWSLTLLFSLILNPYLLLSAAGQLSFGMTAYIIFLAPKLQKIVPSYLRLIAFSLSLSILSVPIVSFNFFEWQMGSLILTIILMPLFSLVLMPGLLALLVSNSVIPVPKIIESVDYILMNGQSFLFKINAINVVHIVTGTVPVVILFICIGISIYWLGLKTASMKSSCLLLGGMLLLVSSFKYFDPRGIVAFVDVGQGDGLVIKQPFNQGTIIVDTGGRLETNNSDKESWQEDSGKNLAVNYDIVPVLKGLGVSTLDAVFITHGHIDHFGNLPIVAEQFEIKKLIYPKGTRNQTLFNELAIKLAGKKIPQKEVLAGKTWEMGSYRLRALAPITEGKGGNDNSLVLESKIKDKHFMFMGDLEKAGEEDLVKRYPALKTDILRTGHHGSKTSSNEFFIDQVHPDDAIISCGVDNRFGHPNQETLDNLAKVHSKVLRTDQQGMIYYTWTPFSRKLSRAKCILSQE